MNKTLAKGQEVYIVPRDNRDKPFYAKVISVGSKYITVYGLHYTDNKFYTSDWIHINSRYDLYLSEKAYKEAIAADKKARELCNYCSYNLRKLNYEQLCIIENLIKKYIENE